MEKKFTPGPWVWAEQPVKSAGYYIQTKDMSHKNTFIGEAGGGLQSPRMIKANAMLMAAAPELFDMLEIVTQQLKAWEEIGTIYAEGMIKNIETLLTKATTIN